MTLDYSIWENRRALTDNPAAGRETFQKAGRELFELDQLAEALEFLARAGDEEGLKSIQARAAAEGHFFLYQSAAAKRPGGGLDRLQLQELAENAEKNGLDLYAAQARSFLENKP